MSRRRGLTPSRRRGPRRSDRGAAMVEFAIILPVLALFAFGVLEVSMVIRDRGEAVTASTVAQRAAAHLGPARMADYNALTAVLGSVRERDMLQRVVIFKPTASGAVPPGCTTTSQSGKCNVYNKTFLTQLATAEDGSPGAGAVFFGGVSSCSGSSPDRSWCPTVRSDVQSDGLDSIGVLIELQHRSSTGFFGDRTITEQSVGRVEPDTDQ